MRPIPLAAAAVLVIALLLRWRVLPKLVRLAAVAAVAALVLYGAGAFDLPNVQQTLRDAGGVLGKWTYLLVGALVFLETGAFIGLLAPGEVAAIAGGVVAGQGVIDVVPLILLAWACCVAGDNLSFWLGRRLGRAWLLRNGARVLITEERLAAVERFFARHGGATIVIGRFIGFVRPLAPFIAGASRMPPLRFVAYDLVGAGLWCTTFVLLGYVSWRNFDRATQLASRGSLALGALVALVAIVLVVRARHNEGRQ
jgi:undecaprenyl-diphosphatase